jgi:hypothetical protein
VAESLIRVSGLSIGQSGVGLVQLRHREDLMVRRSGRQEEGRREAPFKLCGEYRVFRLKVPS